MNWLLPLEWFFVLLKWGYVHFLVLHVYNYTGVPLLNIILYCMTFFKVTSLGKHMIIYWLLYKNMSIFWNKFVFTPWKLNTHKMSFVCVYIAKLSYLLTSFVFLVMCLCAIFNELVTSARVILCTFEMKLCSFSRTTCI
jgi:hypothetical protein